MPTPKPTQAPDPNDQPRPNQRVAAEAADYLVRMLITRDLKKYATYMDLESGTTRSKYIAK